MKGDVFARILPTDSFRAFDLQVSFIVNAVSAYSAALRLAQLKTCKDGAECDHSQMAASVTESLRTLNFPLKVAEGTTQVSEAISTKPTIATEHELEGTRSRVNHQGKLISRRYNILYSEPTQMISKVRVSRAKAVILWGWVEEEAYTKSPILFNERRCITQKGIERSLSWATWNLYLE